MPVDSTCNHHGNRRRGDTNAAAAVARRHRLPMRRLAEDSFSWSPAPGPAPQATSNTTSSGNEAFVRAGELCFTSHLFEAAPPKCPINRAEIYLGVIVPIAALLVFFLLLCRRGGLLRSLLFSQPSRTPAGAQGQRTGTVLLMECRNLGSLDSHVCIRARFYVAWSVGVTGVASRARLQVCSSQRRRSSGMRSWWWWSSRMPPSSLLWRMACTQARTWRNPAAAAPQPTKKLGIVKRADRVN